MQQVGKSGPGSGNGPREGRARGPSKELKECREYARATTPRAKVYALKARPEKQFGTKL